MIKPHHINYNLSNYNMEQNYRIKKEEGCMFISTRHTPVQSKG